MALNKELRDISEKKKKEEKPQKMKLQEKKVP